MRTPYDQLSKGMLRDVFSSCGAVGTDEEVSAEPQRIDVWFVPDRDRRSGLEALGLLGRLSQQATAFEAFHRTPGVTQVLDCLRKHLVFRQVRARRGIEERSCMWILSTGAPQTAIEQVGLRPRAEPGIYEAAPALSLGLVVLGELHRTRDTLLLRLMGAGRTLRAALADLRALPPDALEASVAIPHLLRLNLELSASTDAEDQELVMETKEWYANWQREQRRIGAEEGMREGMREGIREGMREGALSVARRQLERKLGRGLAEAEVASLADKVARLGGERIGDVVLDLDGNALASWLADPNAS